MCRIALTTYPAIAQNVGGIQMRLHRTRQALNATATDAALFNQWKDKVEAFDILHVFKLHHSTHELVVTAKARGVKVVISAIVPPELPADKLRLMTYAWRKGVLTGLTHYMLFAQAQLANAVLATSAYEAEVLRKAYNIPWTKLHVIPSAVDGPVFTAATQNLFGDTYGVANYILTIGRIEPNKNQLRLIEAAQRLGRPLVIVGKPGVGADDYAYQCRQAAGGRVLFIDELPYNSALLASAYAGAAAFVLPSLSEIAPNTTLEAMLAGTRVVVTKNSLSPREWFGDRVLYVDPLDVDDLACKIEAAIHTAADAETRVTLLRRHSWEGVAARLNEIYSAALQ
jgi:glycosyltransferase involved in cell wall biosynthesis